MYRVACALRASGQVECKLDGARFTSKAAFYLHLRGAHPDRFEDLERLLRSLTEGKRC
jgi:hypothetical protein